MAGVHRVECRTLKAASFLSFAALETENQQGYSQIC